MTLARPSFLVAKQDTPPTLCACSHGEEEHHPAGRCVAALPELAAEELPPWTCPCRRFVASAVTTALLATVQSCTVHAAARASDLHGLLDLAPGLRWGP